MNDERIDELLKDLEAALTVQPSPSVAARVPTRIDRQSVRGPVGWQVAAMAGLAIALVTYGVLRRVEPAPAPAERQAALVPPGDTVPAPSRQGPSDTVDRRSRVPGPALARTQHRPAPAAGGGRPVEPEVIVPPHMGLAFEQLQAAASSGRLTAESFATSETRFEPTAFSPGTVVIQRVEIDTVPLIAPVAGPGPGGPGGSEKEPGPKWPNRPLSRARSTS